MGTRKKILFSLLFVILLWGVPESVLRARHRWKTGTWDISAVIDKNHNLYERHPYQRYVVKPNARFSIGDTEVETNSLGYRGGSVAIPKPAGRFRILCIGGSTTFGVGVDDYEKSWPRRLEAMLKGAHPGADIEVVNASAPGYNTMDNLVAFELNMTELNPDLMIVYHGVNDIQTTADPAFLPDYSHLEKLAYADEKARGLSRILQHSMVWLKCKDIVSEWARPESDKLEKMNQKAVNDAPSAWLREKFHGNLKHLVAIARARNIDVLLSTFAFCHDASFSREQVEAVAKNWSWYSKSLSLKGLLAAQEVVNDAVRELSGRFQVPCADQAANVKPGRENFSDLVHFTEAGEEKMARGFFDAIESGRLIAR